MTAPRTDPPWEVRAADPADARLVASWMAEPHVERYWHQAWDDDRWAKEIAGQRAGTHSLPCLALHGGTPVAYLELYRVGQDVLARHYAALPDDLGVHVAIGTRARTGRGLGRSLLRAVAEGMLAADPACRRVVAEPDARNTASVRAFTAAGFVHCGPLALPGKTAALLVHPRSTADLPR